MDLTMNKEWTFASRLDEEKKIINEIKQIIAAEHVLHDRAEDMMTAVAEACLNAIEHGNEMKEALRVHVRMSDRHDRLCFRIYDEGNGFDYTSEQRAAASLKQRIDDATEPQITRATNLHDMNVRGWGLFLIANLADSVNVGFEGSTFFIEMQFFK